MERVCSRLSASFAKDPQILVGPGDDTAVVFIGGSQIALTTDSQIEDIHFRRRWMSLFDLGWKSVAISLSDLCAMGARPIAIVLSLALTGQEPMEEVDQLFDGAITACKRFSCYLVGGDVARSPGPVLVVSSAIGVVAITPWTRSGAKEGDCLLVTGCPGEAAAGFLLLEKGIVAPDDPMTLRFRRPEPRLNLLDPLLSAPLHAVIDVSDGLALDIFRLAQSSGLTAEIFVDQLPLSQTLRDACSQVGADPIDLALTGGEDYELLLTVPEEAAVRVRQTIEAQGVPATVIGRMTTGRAGLVVAVDEGGRRRILSGGFQHF